MNIISCLSSAEDVSTQVKPVELKDWTNLWDPKGINFESVPHLNIGKFGGHNLFDIYWFENELLISDFCDKVVVLLAYLFSVIALP